MVASTISTADLVLQVQIGVKSLKLMDVSLACGFCAPGTSSSTRNDDGNDVVRVDLSPEPIVGVANQESPSPYDVGQSGHVLGSEPAYHFLISIPVEDNNRAAPSDKLDYFQLLMTEISRLAAQW